MRKGEAMINYGWDRRNQEARAGIQSSRKGKMTELISNPNLAIRFAGHGLGAAPTDIGAAPHNLATPPIEEAKRGRCKSRAGWPEGNHP